MLRPFPRIAVLAALVALLSFPTTAGAAGIEAKAAFERLKTLAGSWSGTAAGEPANVVYRLASGGSVVMETIMPGTPHEMISMYHLEGDDLVMVHYCAMGNQPKLRLDRASSTADVLRFEYVSGTNLNPERDGHVHDGVLTFRADGSLGADWGFWQAGKAAGVNNFELKRAGG